MKHKSENHTGLIKKLVALNCLFHGSLQLL